MTEHRTRTAARLFARPTTTAALVALGWCSPCLADTPARASASGSAQEVEQAERYAAEAIDAFRRKEYASAVALYRRAFDLSPSADLLYNTARVYDTGLRDRQLALSFYRRYVVDPGAVPERIEKANLRIAELSAAEWAMLDAAPPPGAAPAMAPTATRGPGASAPTDGQDSPSESYWSTARSVGLVFGISGIVAAAVGAGYGLDALSDADVAHAECDGTMCRSQEGVDAVESADTKASIATLAFAVGGALMGTGALLWLTNPGASSPERGSHAALGWTPVADGSEVGFQLNGRW